MEIDLALLADAATVDASGKLNLLGIFDRITASQFPAIHGRFSLVIRFSAGIDEAGDHDVVISLTGPTGDQVVPPLQGKMQVGPGPVRLGAGIRFPYIFNLDGVQFPMPGRYTFDVRVDGEHLISLPLHLDQIGGGARA